MYQKLTTPIEERANKYSLFIGRWQPFHNGHDHIVHQALQQGKKVCIAIRDTPVSESDPYTMDERIDMIRYRFRDYGDSVVVVWLPDIESVNIGRQVGYDVIRYDSPDYIEGISATQIREMIGYGDNTWTEFVPEDVAVYLQNLHANRPTLNPMVAPRKE